MYLWFFHFANEKFNGLYFLIIFAVILFAYVIGNIAGICILKDTPDFMVRNEKINSYAVIKDLCKKKFVRGWILPEKEIIDYENVNSYDDYEVLFFNSD